MDLDTMLGVEDYQTYSVVDKFLMSAAKKTAEFYDNTFQDSPLDFADKLYNASSKLYFASLFTGHLEAWIAGVVSHRRWKGKETFLDDHSQTKHLGTGLAATSAAYMGASEVLDQSMPVWGFGFALDSLAFATTSLAHYIDRLYGRNNADNSGGSNDGGGKKELKTVPVKAKNTSGHPFRNYNIFKSVNS